MARFARTTISVVVLAALFAFAPTAIAEDAAGDNGDSEGASAELSVGGDALEPDAKEGGRPTHRQFNLHFAGGVLFGLGDDLSDAGHGDIGGQAAVGLDIVLVEPLALSIMGGFNPMAENDDESKAALRSVFIGAGLMLRMFSSDEGALFDGGTAAGSLWLDAHIDYFAHKLQDHGGYDIGLGYEFALWKDVNLGPYVRFQHVAWGEGLNFMEIAVGLMLSFGGTTGPDDRDGDGILDPDDKCPDEAEDKDGFEDADGCPDTDNDKDGVLDADDKCPDVAGIPEKQGCPNDDNDADGILNDVDKCPDEAEDVDEFEDEDGCPEADNDQDGVLDADDKCPTEKEDMDGFEDADGCPDNDNDGDGIPDATDQCPNEAENMNGKEDEDGCPDLVRIVGDQIKISDKVYFATNKDKILDKSFDLLKQVAVVIQSKPDMKVRVEGHTDDVGKDAKNLKLSQRRAESVVKFLVDEGVAADRLTAEGLGETKPIADNKTEEGRAENRRVEFHIVESAPAEAPAEAAPAPEAAPEPAPAPAPAEPAPATP
ncbi:MAG: OmpA family protein [Proteobacteria bacterium]|jgi:outer membrane protein OmpA-like peptidoglycan-associated protein|nr:OmpA family protein [Pseudomonadota bacterium]